MLGILLIVLVAGYAVFLHPILREKREAKEENSKNSVQMEKLWKAAQTSMREHKMLRAENYLLRILKMDEKNAAAYNRLGILYANEQKYDEAIECLEIAQSLDNNAASLHNAGLIYLKTGAYEKAEMAFQQALRLEDDMPTRYIALSKAEEKLGKRKQALESLEKAYELSPTVAVLRQILALHEAAGDTEAITATTARIEQQMAENAKKRAEAAKAKARKEAAARAAKTRAARRTSRQTPKIMYPKVRRATKAQGTTRATRATTTKATTAAAARPTKRRKIIQ